MFLKMYIMYVFCVLTINFNNSVSLGMLCFSFPEYFTVEAFEHLKHKSPGLLVKRICSFVVPFYWKT